MLPEHKGGSSFYYNIVSGIVSECLTFSYFIKKMYFSLYCVLECGLCGIGSFV